MELQQCVKLKDDHTHYERDETIIKKDFNGVKAQGHMENNFIDLELSNAKQKMHKDSKVGKKGLTGDDLLLAGYLQPTTTGKCVKIEYRLVVKCIYDDTC